MRTALIVLLAASVALAPPGCATMVSGPTQHIVLRSDPPGAKVLVNGAVVGNTPCSFSISRWQRPVFTFRLEGYEDATATLYPYPNEMALLDLPWFLLGIIPGVIAVAVDCATGAVFRLAPDHVHVTLEKRQRRRTLVAVPVRVEAAGSRQGI